MHPFDEITVDQLRAAGSTKWTTFPDAIGAFIAEMDFGVPPAVAEVVRTAADSQAMGYLPAADRAAAKRATAHWLARSFDWQVPEDTVHLLPDVLSALRIAVQRFTPPGSPVIVPTPAYMPFLTVVPAVDRQVIEVPSLLEEDGRYRLDLEAIDAAFAAGAGLLVLCNPWNPVGRVLTREELSAVAEVVDRHGGRVFSDEIHAPLVLDDLPHIPYASLDARTAGHTITAVAASKGWNIPGLKCGQMILSNPDDVAAFAPYATDAGDTVGLLGGRGAVAAYTESQDWLEDVVTYLRGNRDLLVEMVDQIPGLRVSPVEGTYIAWLDCRELDLPGGPAQFFRREAGVALTDGTSCGRGGDGFARLIFASPRPVLEQALTQMRDAAARR
ncbi:aminotransferase class I/II-fold pyridoxal phosphate-dependent enzyme [Georgenia satyanarayanai]|uniref:MalY/PatB family protein n=1 Tax=Georgenia satyanarayanai TaxID=860221 RepID=UPI002040ADC4|nr:aminotransferase class I/II-fold pyridoxal phosphate-dependent enzyme [Georgenia satyanarayanai]MCM3659797.1 aminotransferase class I/II-fold pyridoxal phosphate-dependent enzyme [Georgenia satyanarayanai]